MGLKERLYHIVFETESPAAKRFDVVLLWTILLSVLVVMVESVPAINRHFKLPFVFLEWFFTVVFTLEYALRIWISPKPRKYIFSFWGIVDLLAILPTYLSLILAGSHYLLVVRIFRLLRVFRILKLARFNNEAQILMGAMRESLYKISLFFVTVLAIVVILGTVMYVVEGGENGFTSIPQSIYWAIITITTVGYGDVVPVTVLGKFISSFAMIIGYAIIAVPTGIVTVAMSRAKAHVHTCAVCGTPAEWSAKYCSQCGTSLKKV